MPKPTSEIPPEDVPAIQAAAMEVMMKAMAMVSGRTDYAIGALSMALGTSAAMLKVPYAALVAMLSAHYENQLLDEIEKETEAAGGVMVAKEVGDY